MRAGGVLAVLAAFAASAPASAGRAAEADAALAPPADGGAAEEEIDAPTVGASLDRTEAHVGDRLTLTVSVVGRAAIVASGGLPVPLDLGKFELLDSSRTDRDLGNGKSSRRFVLQVASYDTGELEVPPIAIAYVNGAGQKRSAATGAIPVVVKSVLEDRSAGPPTPQPLRPTRSVMVEDTRLERALAAAVAALAAAALAFAIALAVRRRRGRPAPVVAAPVVPPHLIALERLRALRLRGHFHADQYRPFFFEVAEIVRAYLGARFGFDALELTTTELLAALAGGGSPATDGRERVARFLETCDLVKFAQAPSDDPQAEWALREAEELVNALGAPPSVEAPAPVDGAHG